MANVWKDRSFRMAMLLTLCFLGLGFVFLHVGLGGYGIALFVLLPIVVGVSIGALPDKMWAINGAIIGLGLFFIFLLVGHFEGFLCVLMSLPIIVPMLFLGSIIGHLMKRYRVLREQDQFSISLLPLLVVLASPAEKLLVGKQPVINSVTTRVVLPYTTRAVYEAIKQVDTMDAAKPYLMRLNLPVPQKCVLQREAVGGLRTCYFEGGTITERITQLEKGRVLQMDVIDYQLTGRKWLGFREAIYHFDRVGTDSCRITRVTTYTSELKPRMYWKPLEELGIQQEHEYVFNNLLKDLNSGKGQQ